MTETFVAADLGHASLRREIAVQNDQSARGLQRMAHRSDDLLSRSFFRSVSFFRECASGDRKSRAIGAMAIQQAFGDERNASGLIDVGGYESSCRLQVSKQRSAFADFLEIVHHQSEAGLARNRQQVQHRIGRSASAGHARDRILKSRADQNVFRTQATLEQIQNNLSAAECHFILARIHGGHSVEAHG